MNSKSEAIKAAYGEFWENVRLSIDDNGWFDMAYSEQVPNFDHLWDTSDKRNAKIRPKSLSGIENNRGWTRIESEEDLPGNINSLWIRYSDGSIVLGHYNIFQKKFETVYGKCFDGDTVTHYQPIETPKPPIF